MNLGVWKSPFSLCGEVFVVLLVKIGFSLLILLVAGVVVCGWEDAAEDWMLAWFSSL